MAHSRGFTLIEIVVTITVMVILMAVAVVALRSTQVTARDQERKSDAEAIARGFEERYIQGNPVATMPWPDKGSYPGINEMIHATWGEGRAGFTPERVIGGYPTKLLPGVTEQTIRDPGGNGPSISLHCVWACAAYGTPDYNTNVYNSTNVYGLPQGYRYVYVPVDRNNNICCCGDCQRFFLYYRTEADQQLHTIKSKRQ